MSIEIKIDEFREYLDGPILDLVDFEKNNEVRQYMANQIIQKIVDQLKNKAKKGIIEFDENSGIITIDEKKINAIKLEEGEISPLRGIKIIQNLSFENIEIKNITPTKTSKEINNLITQINVKILKSFDYFINYELTERANRDYEERFSAKTAMTKTIETAGNEVKNDDDIQNSPPGTPEHISKQMDPVQKDIKLKKTDFDSPEKISIFNSMNQYVQKSNVNLNEEEKFLNKIPSPTRVEIFNRVSGRKNNPTPQKNNGAITDEQARKFFSYAIQQRKENVKNIKSNPNMDNNDEEEINKYFKNMSLKDFKKEVELYQNGIYFSNNNFKVKLSQNESGATYENQGAMRSAYKENNPVIKMIDKYPLQVVMKVVEKALEKKLNKNKIKILSKISKRLEKEQQEDKKSDKLNTKKRANSLKNLNESSPARSRRLSSFGSFKNLGFSNSFKSLSSLGSSFRRLSDADDNRPKTPRSRSPRLRKDTDD